MKFETATFDAEVLKCDLPVLVDFYADWCGPCKMMSPVVDELAEQYKGQIKVGKINVDDDPSIAEKYGVMSIPTFIFFKNGEAVDMSVGAIPKAYLEEKIRKVIG